MNSNLSQCKVKLCHGTAPHSPWNATCYRSNHNKTDFKMIFIQTGATNPPPPLNLCYFTFSLPLKTRYLRLETNCVIIIKALHNSLPLSLSPMATYLSRRKRPFLWKCNVYTHGRRLLSAISKNVLERCSSRGFYFILLAAFSSLLFYFFPPCAHPEEKKKKQTV